MTPSDEQRFQQHRHLGGKNIVNAVLCVVVMLPSIWLCAWAFGQADPTPHGAAALPAVGDWFSANGLKTILVGYPLLAVNLLFLINVCLLFWLINLVQRSTWLIDPYWTILPLMIAHFYAAHPLAQSDPLRAKLTLIALWVWSIRLTYNYFRRERFKFGVREDWRFEKKRAESKHFWWLSLFYAYVSQQVMLVGLTLPYYAIFTSSRPFGVIDGVLAAAALAGVLIAHLADSQLYNFVEANRQRIARGEAKVQLLETGLWGYSRHPNYFGEQLFWWAIGAYGFLLGKPWVIIGTVINSIVLAVVTVMTERRIREAPGRATIYNEYCRRTSVLIPWFRRAK